MRRLVFPAILACGLVMAGAVPASAEPAPAGTTAKAAAGKKVCKIADAAMPELSGLVALDDGFIAVNDGSDQDSRRKIFILGDDCQVTKRIDLNGRDAEDMVLSPDGKTIWIADIGDNAARDNPSEARGTIALWSLPATGKGKPKIHRLAYPGNERHDAEALLLNGDGTPIIVTKETVGKPSLVFVPAAALKTDNEAGVPLKKAGEVTLPRTDTPGTPIARLAQGVITGGAVAPQASKVVLRTYLDAFEWDVSNGDVLAALKTKPRITGLPNEPFGEAIAYSPDGKFFYTVSDMGNADAGEDNYILKYTPVTKVVEAKAGAEDKKADSGPSWFSELSLTDITYLIGAVGLLGLILVGAGIFGIMRSRKRRKLDPPTDDADPTTPTPLDAKTELLSVGGPAQRPGVYGGNRPPAGAPSGPVYGGAKPPAAAPAKGPVYGGQPAARPGQGGPPANRPGGARPTGPGAPAAPAGPARPAGPANPGVGAGQPARPGQGGRPGQPAGRPGQGGQPVQPGRPGQGGQPAARPGQGGQPPARPGQGGQPAGRPGQGGKPGGGPGQGGQPGRPGQGGQPAGRPGPAGQPAGRPGQGGQPAGRPGPAGQPVGRPGQSGQPGRPGEGGQPGGRPAQGGQPGGRPGQGGQPGGRPAPGGQPPARPSGGQPGGGQQPGGRPGQGGARPGGGVYGAPPPPPPSGRPQGGARPPGPAGQQGRPDGNRQNGMNNYADLNGSPRENRFDNPGYGRGTPRGY